MDTAPVVVDCEATIEQVSTQAMQRDDTHLYDDVIITRKGLLLGTVSVQDLLTHLAQAQGVLQVAGGTAHELNQPLQVVLGHSEILARGFREDFHEDDVQAILGGVTRMAQITKRLQNLTHYRTAPYLAECAIVDLSTDTH
jgi:signal transduction histidine kinase